MPHPAFHAYAYADPEPVGFSALRLQPDPAFHYPELRREFVLPYDAMRGAADPDTVLLAFARSSYDAAAELGGRDRARLER